MSDPDLELRSIGIAYLIAVLAALAIVVLRAA
jgi:hypothetical protein